MFKQKLAFVLFTLAIMSGVSSSSLAQISVADPVNLEQMRLENVKIGATGIADFFSRLSLTYDIPIGLEIARYDNESDAYCVDFKQGTLGEFLTQFVAGHEEYTWQINQGVVSIFPKDQYRDAVLRELLETNIDSFSIKARTACGQLGDALVATPEINRVIKDNGMKYTPQALGGFYIKQLGQHFALDFSRTNLKTILNKVVQGSPVAKVWIMKKVASEKTFSIRLNARLEYPVKEPGGLPRTLQPECRSLTAVPRA